VPLRHFRYDSARLQALAHNARLVSLRPPPAPIAAAGHLVPDTSHRSDGSVLVARKLICGVESIAHGLALSRQPAPGEMCGRHSRHTAYGRSCLRTIRAILRDARAWGLRWPLGTRIAPGTADILGRTSTGALDEARIGEIWDHPGGCFEHDHTAPLVAVVVNIVEGALGIVDQRRELEIAPILYIDLIGCGRAGPDAADLECRPPISG
jgi:hypothetical protein